MKPGDRLICAFVEPVAVGQQFSLWLLHVTIVPWFRADDTSENIATGLKRALQPVKPFEFRLGDEARFGPKRNRPAYLVEGYEFASIEQRVRKYFHKKRAWLVDETTKLPRQFRPHITLQTVNNLSAGQVFDCRRLYIVEQRGDTKEVVAEITLG